MANCKRIIADEVHHKSRAVLRWHYCGNAVSYPDHALCEDCWAEQQWRYDGKSRAADLRCLV